jgi:hypothetical protein
LLYLHRAEPPAWRPAGQARSPEPPSQQSHQRRHQAEIAEDLCISELTMKSHIGRIFVKLDLRDRAAAIVYA